MAEKQLHNFQFPNALKWNIQGVLNRRSPRCSHIFHSAYLKIVTERAHASFIGKVYREVKKTTNSEAKLKDVMTSEGEKIEGVINKELVDVGRIVVEGNEKTENATDFIGGIEEETGKSWNFRLRSNNGLKASGSAEKEKAKFLKGSGSGSGGEKLNFIVPSTTLAQTEIKEDYYVFGLKMPRRPKKRPKHAQNRLFPGNNLTNIFVGKILHIC